RAEETPKRIPAFAHAISGNRHTHWKSRIITNRFFLLLKINTARRGSSTSPGDDWRWKGELSLTRMQSFSLADRGNGTGERVGRSTRRAFSRPTYRNCSITTRK